MKRLVHWGGRGGWLVAMAPLPYMDAARQQLGSVVAPPELRSGP